MFIVTSRLSAQFISFTIIGALGTGVHYLVLFALVSGAGVAPVYGTTVGAFCGAIINYVLNYRLTFRSRKRHTEALSRFLIVAGIGLVINAAIVGAGTGGTTWHYLVFQVIATVVVLLWGFGANRMWTFRGDGDATL